MCRTTLHKSPTQTVEKSQGFGMMNSLKGTKSKLQKDKNLGENYYQRSGTGLSRR